MSDKTKAVNLTEDEIEAVLSFQAAKLVTPRFTAAEKEITDSSIIIDRINYLNKRLKAFKEPETEVKSDNSAAGWGATNG